MPELIITSNLEELATKAAELFVSLAADAIEETRSFSVALSGGSTPLAFYRCLTSGSFRERVDWARAFFFFGDERNVPPDSRQSNFGLANTKLFNPLEISSSNVFRWKTELSRPGDVAKDYSSQIDHFFHGFPRFDVFVLGLGADGHTASLFPHSEALAETKRIAAANWIEILREYRFTLTIPVINNARNVIFLVSGAQKREAVSRVLEGERRPDEFPAQLVSPEGGSVTWLLDTAAASLLTVS